MAVNEAADEREASRFSFVAPYAHVMAGELNLEPRVDLNNGADVVDRLRSRGWAREAILLCMDEAVTRALAQRSMPGRSRADRMRQRSPPARLD